MPSCITPFLKTTLSVAALLIGVIQCQTKTNDEYCTPGSGNTTIEGRVLNSDTQKPLDSVNIRIVWGISWDLFLDTLVYQNDNGFTFTFNLKDDCEPYFVTLSNPRYWTDFDGYPVYNASLNKGETNNFEFGLKPATVLKVTATHDTLNTVSDAVTLEIKKTTDKDWQDWDISTRDFTYLKHGLSKDPTNDIGTIYNVSDSTSHRTITTYHTVESTDSLYEIRWIRSAHDTLHHRFTAQPFDTIHLHYNFTPQTIAPDLSTMDH